MTRGGRQPRWVTAATALAMLLSAGLLTAAGVVISNAATVPEPGVGDFLSVIGTAEPAGETPPIVDDAPQAAGTAPDATNFKLVPWESVADAFDPPLDVDPGGFDPRD